MLSTSRFVLLLMLCALAPLLTGCEKNRADKLDIQAVWNEYWSPSNPTDGEAAATILTSNSFDYYARAMQLAMSASAAETKKLSPALKDLVLRIRTRTTRDKISKLDGRGFVVWSVSQGWSEGVERDEVIELGSVSVHGTNASARMIETGKPTSYMATFRKEDGAWRLDENSVYAIIDELIARFAREQGTDVDRLILSQYKDEHGYLPGEAIWNPMP
ncbi:MAG TPA: hypothetical protein VKD72_13780 [Gemmataceae bacterium]|nr:hypothetical protein [Gemmataceae bacterium]